MFQMIYATRVGGTDLVLARGDLRDLSLDAVACYSSTSLTLHSNLAQRLVERGGSFIRSEGSKHAPARVGQAVVLPAGRLPCRYLIAGVANQLREAPGLEGISACVAAVLDQAAQLGLRSLALPLLRAGRALSPEDVLRATLAPLFDHCHTAAALSSVLIVSDTDEPPESLAWLAPYARGICRSLAELGQLRARAGALGELAPRAAAAAVDLPASPLAAAQLDVQLQIQGQLQQSLARGEPGRNAILLELRRCEVAQARIMGVGAPYSGGPARERALGEI